MNIVKFVLESRGPVNLTKRTLQVVSRFGLSPSRMGQRFDRFMDVLDRYQCRPTFPITALPMSRNPSFAHRLLERGAELAVHAHTHIDLTTLTYKEQSEHMGRALQLFRRHSVPFTGFRAPYLHWNDDTMRVVDDYQFLYSSNEIVMWDVIDLDPLTPEQRDGFEKGKAFYKPRSAESMFVVPFARHGFVEIPVSLPDDEIMLDRMYLKDVSALSEAWHGILEKTYERGELFTIQLHPERIDFFSGALGGLLAACRQKDPGVWIATLDEIARWWKSKSQNTADFVKRPGGYTAHVRGAEGATVYLRERGESQLLKLGSVHIEGDLRPCVGVSAGSDRDAVQLLRDRGYILETGDAGENFAIHLGKLRDASFEQVSVALRQLDVFRGPLVHFGTWPHGHRSAVAVTGDIDALTLWDFMHRFRGA